MKHKALEDRLVWLDKQIRYWDKRRYAYLESGDIIKADESEDVMQKYRKQWKELNVALNG